MARLHRIEAYRANVGAVDFDRALGGVVKPAE